MKIARWPRILIPVLGSSIALILMSSCAPMSNDTEPRDTVYALDGVKLISTSIDRGVDPRTFNQRTYTLDGGNRLLLRYESLSSASLTILSEKPVLIRVFAVDSSSRNLAIRSLKVCPLQRNWMMAATWTSAHPSKGGAWEPGGSLELDECIGAVDLASNETTPATSDASSLTDSDLRGCSESNAVCFNISLWYKNYVVQRRINYGLALVSSDGQPVTIYGDAAGAKVPRIHWSGANRGSGSTFDPF